MLDAIITLAVLAAAGTFIILAVKRANRGKPLAPQEPEDDLRGMTNTCTVSLESYIYAGGLFERLGGEDDEL